METNIKNMITDWLDLDRSISNQRCPFRPNKEFNPEKYFCHVCNTLFPRTLKENECPCDCYTFNYILRKARKYTKET